MNSVPLPFWHDRFYRRFAKKKFIICPKIPRCSTITRFELIHFDFKVCLYRLTIFRMFFSSPFCPPVLNPQSLYRRPGLPCLAPLGNPWLWRFWQCCGSSEAIVRPIRKLNVYLMGWKWSWAFYDIFWKYEIFTITCINYFIYCFKFII